MRLSELIRTLVLQAMELNESADAEDTMYAGIDVDPEVRIAYQPTYPLAAHLCCATHIAPDADQPGVLWLAAGSSPCDSPYAPRAAWGE